MEQLGPRHVMEEVIDGNSLQDLRDMDVGSEGSNTHIHPQ